ncbi:hypothetical protein BH11MYX1_BH11MYX1_51870 [soil metagenome]
MRAGLALVMFAACAQPSTSSSYVVRPSEQLEAFDLAGDWTWAYKTEERGTSRTEEEQWRLRSNPTTPAQLTGRYVRTVTVHSLDHSPFQCNQMPWYRQRSLYDVVVELVGKELVVKETGYATEPSPCDHGFRHLGDYHAPLASSSLVLRWGQGAESGVQTLTHVDPTRGGPLPSAPWPASYAPTGTWRWNASSVDAAGNIHDELEWWEITRRSETRLDATYRRRVTVRSVDGKTPIACAGKPSWTFDDAYVLEGQKEEGHWHLHELAVEPGDHPCLRATPRRTLDEATAEQIGDFFVLEWRGKRREILYRPDPAGR